MTLAQNEWFKQANILAKYASAQDQWMAQEITRDLPIYPRDLLISAMAGRLFERLTIDGQEFYSMAVLQDISSDLDLLGGKDVGNLLVRGTTLWTKIEAGDEGQVLTAHGPNATPTWQAGGGGGGAYWSSTLNQGNQVTNLAATRGFVVRPMVEILIHEMAFSGNMVDGTEYRASIWDLALATTLVAEVGVTPTITIPAVDNLGMVLVFPAPVVLQTDRQYFLCVTRTDGANNAVIPLHRAPFQALITGIPNYPITVSNFGQRPGEIAQTTLAIGQSINLPNVQGIYQAVKMSV